MSYTISFAIRLLGMMLCAASMSAMSQSSLQDEQTRRTQRLPESPGADMPDEVIEAAVTLELQHDPLVALPTTRT